MNTRRFLATTIAAVAAFVLPLGTAHAQKKPSLNIYCWSEYIPQSVIDGFSKQFKVKVNVENYASNEEMLPSSKRAARNMISFSRPSM